MEVFSNLFDSVDGNIIEYCILAGIVVLVIILICSIVSCVKSLGGKKTKKSFISDDIEATDDDNDYVNELISVAQEENMKESEIVIEPVQEVKIAEKIEISEIVEEHVDELVEDSQVSNKLDIQSITREMELKLEEEPIDSIDVYEDEQEKTAIISYKELLAAASKIEANADKEEEYLDDEVVFEFNSKKIMQEEPVIETQKKFKPTVDISPVFGAKKTEVVEQDDLFQIEEVFEEQSSVENSESFLKNLQDFRSNLD